MPPPVPAPGPWRNWRPGWRPAGGSSSRRATWASGSSAGASAGNAPNGAPPTSSRTRTARRRPPPTWRFCPFAGARRSGPDRPVLFRRERIRPDLADRLHLGAAEGPAAGLGRAAPGPPPQRAGGVGGGRADAGLGLDRTGQQAGQRLLPRVRLVGGGRAAGPAGRIAARLPAGAAVRDRGGQLLRAPQRRGPGGPSRLGT